MATKYHCDNRMPFPIRRSVQSPATEVALSLSAIRNNICQKRKTYKIVIPKWPFFTSLIIYIRPSCAIIQLAAAESGNIAKALTTATGTATSDKHFNHSRWVWIVRRLGLTAPAPKVDLSKLRTPSVTVVPPPNLSVLVRLCTSPGSRGMCAVM